MNLAEERLFATTNYYEELTNFYPSIKFKLYFVGLELSTQRHLKSHKINDNLEGFFYRGSVAEFIIDQGMKDE